MDYTIRGAIKLLTDYNRDRETQPSRRDIICNEFMLFRARSKARQHRDAWYEPISSYENKGPAGTPGKRMTLTKAVECMVEGIFLDEQ